eukprot:TRINITY_DN43805_c0_g1_i1.p1 TRINITY_DN43805_c0_g1~~TRINITY_DN43805_c0_g1_i1.p1  ORF type:complete len:302 (-),score=51.35 TRINITY_DN43805_c0_g1_i1:227-1051(-)
MVQPTDGATVQNLTLEDGTHLELVRVPEIDESTWTEVTQYLQNNPQTARSLQMFAREPQAIRGWLHTQAMVEHYKQKMREQDPTVLQQLQELENDPELASMFRNIKTQGNTLAAKQLMDEDLMLKIGRKIGGVPSELRDMLTRIEESPLNFHEACKRGDIQAVEGFLRRNQPVDLRDHMGITPLGYSIGANHIPVVKLLTERKADPNSVDSVGNTGVHYAAGYGRTAIAEYFIQAGIDVNRPNAQGQTALTVAVLNDMNLTIKVLKANGARTTP